MKKIILIFLFLPFFAHAQWYKLDSITDQSLNAVSFTDENTGYVAGENGTLFKTTDSGESWFQLELNTDYDITNMCFPAVDTGYIICKKHDYNGYRFKIFKTVNGGAYWTEQDSLIGSDSTGFLNGIDFLDTNIGIAVGRVGAGVDDTYIPQILYTKNGGATWQFFNLHEYFNNYEDYISYVYLNDVAIYDSTHAVAVGMGDAYHTFEFAEDTIIWNCLYEGEPGMSNELFSVCFADENTVFTGGQEGEVYKIENENWSG
ncbi:MAG: YCF48-related protein [Bacteroidota bacterium]|nr:YCF48-related protein [Bacteroidota bacterium]